MEILKIAKRIGYLYQRIGSLLPWELVEKIKVLFFVLMSSVKEGRIPKFDPTPSIVTTGIYAYRKSFKSFFNSENSESEIKALKEGLDPRSLQLLDVLFLRFQNFPEFTGMMQFVRVPLKIFTKDEIEDARAWLRFLRKCFRRWKYDGYYTAVAFYYHHGLKDMPQTLLDYIKKKDFLDLGAYIGDSVLVFQEYGPRKIISFDASPSNAERFWETMRRNNISEENVELIIAGISDLCLDGKIKINDTGTEDVNLFSPGETDVELITIDEFVRRRKQPLDIGLIKMDVEGFGLEAVRGMVETLRKYRPVLSLAIYHNPDEFFKIKPLMESLDLNYRFAIRKFSHIGLTGETCLLAWPAELAASR